MTSKLSDDEKALFAASVGGIVPIKRNQKVSRPPPAAATPKFSRADDAAVLRESLLEDPHHSDLETGDDLNYRASGVKPAVIQRMRRGAIPIEGELDLHSLNSKQANIATSEFLSSHYQAGRRCVRIIHGKGLRSPNGPVLKRKLDFWLPKRHDVLAYCSARGSDGGTGAIYVLLRKCS